MYDVLTRYRPGCVFAYIACYVAAPVVLQSMLERGGYQASHDTGDLEVRLPGLLVEHHLENGKVQAQAVSGLTGGVHQWKRKCFWSPQCRSWRQHS